MHARAATLLALLLSLPGLAASAPRLRPGATAAAAEARIRSCDIVFSDRALSGVPVTLIAKPRRHAAGVAVPAGVASLYTAGNSHSDTVNHHQSGEDGNGEDNGLKKGHLDGDDAGDDDEEGSPREQLLNQELVKNNEFTDGLQHWQHHSALVTDSWGPITASAESVDGKFAAAHTGYSDLNNHGYIEQNVPVPMARNALFSMLYNFVTSEFPDWQGSEYNDFFQVTLTGPSGEKTLTQAEFLNSTSFTAVGGLPAQYVDGWPPGDLPVTGGQTGWKMYNQGALPLKNGIYKLRIEVHDVGDDIVDSAILVDRVSLR